MKTKNEITNELRNYFESSKERNWDNIVRSLKPHGVITAPVSRNINFKLAALPICLVLVAACVIPAFTLINKNKDANNAITANINIISKGGSSETAIIGSFSSVSAITSALNSSPASVASWENNIKNSTSSKIQSSMPKTASNKATGKTASNSSVSNGPVKSTEVIGGDGEFNDISYLDYNHRLYTLSLTHAEPDKIIGYNKPTDTAHSYEICSIKGMDISQSICKENIGEEKDDNGRIYYYKYDYICNDTITVNSTVYDLTGGRDNKYTENGIVIGSLRETLEAVTSDQTVSMAQGMGGKDNEYYFSGGVYGLGIDVSKIVDNVIGVLPNGKVYSIYEIAPSHEIALNLNGDWFLALKKDDTSYNGKSIKDVLKDKGLYNTGNGTGSGPIPTDIIG